MERFSHTVPTMLGFPMDCEALLSALPAEFSKHQFEDIRKTIPGHPMSFSSARKYGIIEVVRTEPCMRKMTCDIWTNPVTGAKYTYDQLSDKWSKELAAQFGVEYLVRGWNRNVWTTPSFYCLPYQEETLEVECYRNIFKVNVEKFKAL